MHSDRFHFVQYLMRSIPLTRGFALKRALLRWCGLEIGKDVRCTSTVRFFTAGDIRIGDNTWIGPDSLFIGGDASIIIGKDCDIAPQASFITGTHEVLDRAHKVAGDGMSHSIEIGDGCWIGARATILGGTKIGACTIVAAGAVVKGEFPDRCLIAGVPAEIRRKLDSGLGPKQ